MSKIPRRKVLTGLASVPFIAKLTRPNRLASAQTGLEAMSVKTPSGRTVPEWWRPIDRPRASCVVDPRE